MGTKVRKAIEDIGGTMPEDLPTPRKSAKTNRNRKEKVRNEIGIICYWLKNTYW